MGKTWESCLMILPIQNLLLIAAQKKLKNDLVSFQRKNYLFILKSVNFKEVTQLVNKLESFLSVSSKPINECFEDAINETLSKRAKKQKELAWLSLKIYQSVDNYDAFCTILEKEQLV